MSGPTGTPAGAHYRAERPSTLAQHHPCGRPGCTETHLTPWFAARCSEAERADGAHDDDIRAGVPDPVEPGVEG